MPAGEQASALLGLLQGVRSTGASRWVARCPSHKDRHASLSIRETDDGRVLVHCFAGCGINSVLESVGLDFDALFPSRIESNSGSGPMKRPFPAADVLRALADETLIIGIIASDLEKGRPVKAKDFERLRTAIERVQAAHEFALGH
jgi:hypothetical protein